MSVHAVKPVSLQDIADRAGVSRNTVSAVLNAKTEARIAPDTQERVRRIAAEIGYRPNRLARSLSRRRTDTLGLLIAGLSNPFFVRAVECVERLAAQAGYHVLTDAPAGGDGPYQRETKLSGWPMDGLIVWTEAGPTLHDLLGAQARTTPVVIVGDQTRERADQQDRVDVDLATGAREAMTAVLAAGRRRPAQAVAADRLWDWTTDARHRTYAEVCAEAGVPLETIHLDRPHATRQAGWEIGGMIAERPAAARPDVLLCHNDVLALGALHRLRRAGLRLPKDIAVLGFDGIEESHLLDTPLSTVSIPVDTLFETALAFLIARIHDSALPPQQAVIPTAYLPGETL